MNLHIRTIHKYTLEDISLRKQEVLQDIRIQHDIISETTQDIFSPFIPKRHNQDSFIKKFNTGMAIFDGVMVGMKVFKSMRKLFRRRK